jgi:hypothetical protein
MSRHLILAAIGALTLTSSAALADWHKPYIHRESNGDWTHYEYNDGVCYYSYERNGSEVHNYKSGDCSHVIFRSDSATPLYAVPGDAD